MMCSTSGGRARAGSWSWPPNKRLEAGGARRLRNEFFFSAPQLKRDPLGSSHTTMGVTIHFEGKLKDHASLEAVVRAADAFARARSWRVEPISEMEAHLARVRDEQDWDYAGPTSGIEILPHERCDPLRLEFDEDLYVQEYKSSSNSRRSGSHRSCGRISM